jgi:hypothetical protein
VPVSKNPYNARTNNPLKIDRIRLSMLGQPPTLDGGDDRRRHHHHHDDADDADNDARGVDGCG